MLYDLFDYAREEWFTNIFVGVAQFEHTTLDEDDVAIEEQKDINIDWDETVRKWFTQRHYHEIIEHITQHILSYESQCLIIQKIWNTNNNIVFRIRSHIPNIEYHHDLPWLLPIEGISQWDILFYDLVWSKTDTL